MKKVYVFILAMFFVAFFSACKPEVVVEEVDTESPIITLSGGTTTIEVGDTFLEPTCNVSDNVDTALTCVKTGAVDVNSVGEYTLWYNATDTEGNTAIEKTFVVSVVYIDSEIPVIVLTGGMTNLEQGDTFIEPVCTVQDNNDDNLTCVKTGAIDVNQVGEYVLTYNATDSSGNAAVEVSFQVEVRVKLTQEELFYNQMLELGIYDENTTDEEIYEFILLLNSREFWDFYGNLQINILYYNINLTISQMIEFNNIYYSYYHNVYYNGLINQDFFYIEGDFKYLDDTKEVLIGYTGSDKDVIIPSGVRTIGFGAFLNEELLSVVIPEGVVEINKTAFTGNSITSVTIPESVESIGEFAFGINPIADFTVLGDSDRFDDCWQDIGLEYELNENYVYADGFGLMSSTGELSYYLGTGDTISIPSEIEGYAVTSIKGGLFAYSGIVDLTIPESVESIGPYTFSSRIITSLTIEGDALRFEDDWKLIGFPYTLAPFVDITADGYIFNPTTSEIVGYNGTETDLVIPSEIEGVAVTSIGVDAFLYKQITSIILPDSVTVIKYRAFAYGSGILVALDLGSGLQEIHYAAFMDHALTSVVIPESVTFIGYSAFSDYWSNPLPISSVSIEGDSSRFDDIWTLIGFPYETATFIVNTSDGLLFNIGTGEIVGYNGSVTQLVIPSEIEGVFVTRIGDYAFDGVTTITSVILPDTVVSIGTRAFASSEGTITMLYLGNGVEVIGDEAFMDHGLTSVIIPDTVTLIGTRAFASLDETITTLHIGNSVEVIKDQAFLGHGLTTIVIPESVTSIGEFAFAASELIVPNPIQLIVINGDETRFYDGWEMIGFPRDLAPFMVTTTSGLEFNTHTGEIVRYVGTSSVVVIPSEIEGVAVTSIGERAFQYFGLTNIIIPDSVISIGEEAFESCGLALIQIPESVESIGQNAFLGNPLSVIIIEGDASRFDDDWVYIGFPIIPA